MFVSKRKLKNLEKRIADLETKVQNQPQEIFNAIAKSVNAQMSKRSTPHQW